MKPLLNRWRVALAAPNDEGGYIGLIPYASLFRIMVVVIIVARVASVHYKRSELVAYLTLCALILLTVSASTIRPVRSALKPFHLLFFLDTAAISITYALSGNPRSDAYLLYALPLMTAAEEYSISQASLVLLGTIVAFAAILYTLQRDLGQITQFGALFLPRTVFLCALMASWGTVVRSLRIRERQLRDLTELNNRLSALTSLPEIVAAAIETAKKLTAAESCFIVLSGSGDERWPESTAFLDSLAQADRDKLQQSLGSLGTSTPIREIVLEVREKFPRAKSKGVLITPITANGYQFGALVLSTAWPAAARRGSIKTCSRAIASTTASSLERAQISRLWRSLVTPLSRVIGTMPSAIVSLSAELDDLMDSAVELGFTYATVSIVDEYRDRVEMLRGLNVPPGWIRRSQYTLKSNDILSYIARTADTVVLEGWDDRLNPEIFERFDHDKLIRIFCPLMSNGAPIGVLESGAPKDARNRVLGEDTIATIKNLCNNKGDSIAVHLPQTSLKQVAQIGTEITSADAASIHVYRDDELVLCGGSGKASAEFIRNNVSAFSKIHQHVSSKKAVSSFDDPRRVAAEWPDLYVLGIRAFMALPLKSDDERISGFLFLAFWRNHVFTHEELEVEAIFLRQIEAIVKNYLHLTESRTTADRAWSLSRLQTVIQSMTVRFRLNDLLSNIAQDILHALDADVVVIYEYRQESGSFMTPVVKGILRDPRQMRGRPNNYSIVMRFLKQAQVVFARDAQKDPLFNPAGDLIGFARREGIVSAAALKLFSDDASEVIGIIFVNYRSRRDFSRDDKQVMNTLASSAAIAITTARDRERAQRSVARLEREMPAIGRNPFGSSIAGQSTNKAEVLNLLLGEATAITGAELGVILWRDGKTFSSKAGTVSRPLDLTVTLPESDSMLKAMASSRHASKVLDFARHQGPYRQIISPTSRSQLAAPLFDRDTLLGLIVIEDRAVTKFSEEDRRFVEALAVQGQMIVQMIDLYGQLESQIRPQRALTQIAARFQSSTQTLETQLRLLLTGITAKEGIGFSRAILLLADGSDSELRGRLSVGALTLSEAQRTWSALETRFREASADQIFASLLNEVATGPSSPTAASPLWQQVSRLSIDGNLIGGAVTSALRTGQTLQVESDDIDPWRSALNPDDENERYTFVCCPLLWGDESLGVLIADDRFLPAERERIPESRMVSLRSFAEMTSLVILNRRLQDRSKAEAFRDLEHQLRSPLQTARSILKGLSGPRDDARKILSAVLARAARVSRSIRLYADLADGRPIRKATIRRITPRRRAVTVKHSIEEGVLLGRPLNVHLKDLSLEVFDLVEVEFDTVLLEQILGNIVDNIYKYALDDREILIEAAEYEDSILVRFVNAGILSTAEAQQCLVHGFRGQHAQQVTGEGSGLGLWIVDQVMRAHDGTASLRVESDHQVVTELVFAANAKREK
jgi:GAF domain-containing protein